MPFSTPLPRAPERPQAQLEKEAESLLALFAQSLRTKTTQSKFAGQKPKAVEQKISDFADRLLHSSVVSAGEKLSLLMRIYPVVRESKFLDSKISSAIASQALSVLEEQKQAVLSLSSSLSPFLIAQSILAHQKFDKYGEVETLYDKILSLGEKLPTLTFEEKARYLSYLKSSLQSAQFLASFEEGQYYAEHADGVPQSKLSQEEGKIRLAATAYLTSAMAAGAAYSKWKDEEAKMLGASLERLAKERLALVKSLPLPALLSSLEETKSDWESVMGKIAVREKYNSDYNALVEVGVAPVFAGAIMELHSNAGTIQYGSALILSGLCPPAGAAAFFAMGSKTAWQGAQFGDIGAIVSGVAMMVPGISMAASAGKAAGTASQLIGIASASWINADMALAIARAWGDASKYGWTQGDIKLISENLLMGAGPHVLRISAAQAARRAMKKVELKYAEKPAAETLGKPMERNAPPAIPALQINEVPVEYAPKSLVSQYGGRRPAKTSPTRLYDPSGRLSPYSVDTLEPAFDFKNIDKTVANLLAQTGRTPRETALIGIYLETYSKFPADLLSKPAANNLVKILSELKERGTISKMQLEQLGNLEQNLKVQQKRPAARRLPPLETQQPAAQPAKPDLSGSTDFANRQREAEGQKSRNPPSTRFGKPGVGYYSLDESSAPPDKSAAEAGQKKKSPMGFVMPGEEGQKPEEAGQKSAQQKNHEKGRPIGFAREGENWHADFQSLIEKGNTEGAIRLLLGRRVDSYTPIERQVYGNFLKGMETKLAPLSDGNMRRVVRSLTPLELEFTAEQANSGPLAIPEHIKSKFLDAVNFESLVPGKKIGFEASVKARPALPILKNKRFALAENYPKNGLDRHGQIIVRILEKNGTMSSDALFRELQSELRQSGKMISSPYFTSRLRSLLEAGVLSIPATKIGEPGGRRVLAGSPVIFSDFGHADRLAQSENQKMFLLLAKDNPSKPIREILALMQGMWLDEYKSVRDSKRMNSANAEELAKKGGSLSVSKLYREILPLLFKCRDVGALSFGSMQPKPAPSSESIIFANALTRLKLKSVELEKPMAISLERAVGNILLLKPGASDLLSTDAFSDAQKRMASLIQEGKYTGYDIVTLVRNENLMDGKLLSRASLYLELANIGKKYGGQLELGSVPIGYPVQTKLPKRVMQKKKLLLAQTVTFEATSKNFPASAPWQRKGDREIYERAITGLNALEITGKLGKGRFYVLARLGIIAKAGLIAPTDYNLNVLEKMRSIQAETSTSQPGLRLPTGEAVQLSELRLQAAKEGADALAQRLSGLRHGLAEKIFSGGKSLQTAMRELDKAGLYSDEIALLIECKGSESYYQAFDLARKALESHSYSEAIGGFLQLHKAGYRSQECLFEALRASAKIADQARFESAPSNAGVAVQALPFELTFKILARLANNPKGKFAQLVKEESDKFSKTPGGKSMHLARLPEKTLMWELSAKSWDYWSLSQAISEFSSYLRARESGAKERFGLLLGRQMPEPEAAIKEVDAASREAVMAGDFERRGNLDLLRAELSGHVQLSLALDGIWQGKGWQGEGTLLQIHENSRYPEGTKRAGYEARNTDCSVLLVAAQNFAEAGNYEIASACLKFYFERGGSAEKTAKYAARLPESEAGRVLEACADEALRQFRFSDAAKLCIAAGNREGAQAAERALRETIRNCSGAAYSSSILSKLNLPPSFDVRSDFNWQLLYINKLLGGVSEAPLGGRRGIRIRVMEGDEQTRTIEYMPFQNMLPRPRNAGAAVANAGAAVAGVRETSASFDIYSLKNRTLTSLSVEEAEYVLSYAGFKLERLASKNERQKQVVDLIYPILSSAKEAGNRPVQITVGGLIASRLYMHFIAGVHFNGLGAPEVLSQAQARLMRFSSHELGLHVSHLLENPSQSVAARTLLSLCGISDPFEAQNSGKLWDYMKNGVLSAARKNPMLRQEGVEPERAALVRSFRAGGGSSYYAILWYSVDPLWEGKKPSYIFDGLEIAPLSAGGMR